MTKSFILLYVFIRVVSLLSITALRTAVADFNNCPLILNELLYAKPESFLFSPKLRTELKTDVREGGVYG